MSASTPSASTASERRTLTWEEYGVVPVPQRKPLLTPEEEQEKLKQRKAEIFKRNQDKSPLMRLPAELRLKIYDYVFHTAPIRPYREHRLYGRWAYSNRQLRLLQVCSQVNSEACFVPFTCNVFAGFADQVLELVLTRLPREKADKITKVEIDADAFAVYREGDIPGVGLQPWFTNELAGLAGLRGLKEVVLLWFGSDM
ncbi:hypothetical protein PtrEW4_006453 [Pyrenophora tritici-repentis]|nr:hypothetical protein PtrSN001C_007999 [Pyrenophora tritici-repentis]KAI1568428.1 hypothetical protein PtrEW4_006453 [Pyrenophora tritici-repentis]KAI1570255.1 hypothetical protein PtrEW7m1_008295 [Pyrenophora tritici-repentis]